MESAAIILAAGKSTRMKSALPKVLHEVCGRPMLAYVLDACRDAGVDHLHVVVGHEKERVMQAFADDRRTSGDPKVTWTVQEEQNGTGHAVMCCREQMTEFAGSVLVIAGDMPLVRRETLASLLESRAETGDAVTLATTILEDPTGYGRIIRDDEGRLEAIVEERDCTAKQREIREVNPSYYCFDRARLFDALDRITPNNAKGEYYLTDAVHILRDANAGVSAIASVAAEDAVGVNSRLDLAMVSRVMEDRIQLAHMEEGVTIVDPDNTWIEAGATIGADTVVYPFTCIERGATVGARCRIGPFVRVCGGESIPAGSEIRPTAASEVGA
jgi:bifunctional UDP-N-acetylglucosamine pyrophosphorylase/glucosamine-1-phosphate N-acetyltransferase